MKLSAPTSLTLAGILLMCAFGSARACSSHDAKRSLDMVGEAAEALLDKKDFKGLDAQVNQYRHADSLASDGQPNLAGFYGGLAVSRAGCEHIAEASWAKRRAQLLAWGKHSRDPGAAALALAMLDASEAWNARGGGYAATVSEEGWRRFHLGLASAKGKLDKIATLATVDPQWYQAMLNLGLAQGWERERFDKVYAAATAAYPYYLGYYFTKGAFYGQMWHGSPKEFTAFVEETVAATAPKMGQVMYTRLHWSGQSVTMFKDGQTDWPRMKAGFISLLKDYPDSWNRNNFAKFACRAQDFGTTDEQIKLIGTQVIQAAWNERYEYCKQRAEMEMYAIGSHGPIMVAPPPQ